MKKNLYERINEHKDKFSKGFKKIATQIYRDSSVFAVQSAKDVGKQIGVSETTIIRFANTLGYSGYRDMQQDIQYQIFQKSSLSDYRETKANFHSNNNSVKSLMVNDIIAIETAIEQIPETDLEQTVAKLTDADNILVSGVRSSYALASWFAFALDLVIGNTRQYAPNEDALLRVSELNADSVFTAFSFHRYGKDTINLAKLAKKQGATTIAFTDNPYSPISEYSDIMLAIQLPEQSTLDLAPVVFSLMNSIISSISLKLPSLFQQRTAQFDGIQADEIFYNN